MLSDHACHLLGVITLGFLISNLPLLLGFGVHTSCRGSSRRSPHPPSDYQRTQILTMRQVIRSETTYGGKQMEIVWRSCGNKALGSETPHQLVLL